EVVRVMEDSQHKTDQSVEHAAKAAQALETITQAVSVINDMNTQIASAAEELSAVTEETSAGVNSQKVETDQVATAMHEMTA
ncbi:methyl-accepting chemotaxis protein, partial [Pseudomonas sp. SIMBA_077]